MKTETKRGKDLKIVFLFIYLLLEEEIFVTKREEKKSPQPFVVRLIKNICDFLLKQLGLFLTRSEQKAKKVLYNI